MAGHRGAWPASASTPEGLTDYRERLHAYAEKAAREASEVTGWWEQDEAFEERMHALVDAATGPAAERVRAFVDEISADGWSNGLSAKLLQILGPGVPDVYQGSELWEQSLVDPDNRRPSTSPSVDVCSPRSTGRMPCARPSTGPGPRSCS